MSTNNKISSLVNSQLPFFIRNEYPNFIEFLSAYFRYLEQDVSPLQEGKAIERSQNLLKYMDIDTTLDDFTSRLYDAFLAEFPNSSLVDKKMVLKRAGDLYRAKGTEKSFRFLMRALYNAEISFYYPKSDILIASGGNWYVQEVLKVNNTIFDGVANNSLSALQLYVGNSVRGATSNATAIIEDAQRSFTHLFNQFGGININNVSGGTQIDELTISSLDGTFVDGEQITCAFTDNSGFIHTLTSNVFSGIIDTITITNPGSGYTVGEHVALVGGNPTLPAFITVLSVSSGNTSTLGVIEGGAGFRVNDYLLFTDGAPETGNAYVAVVAADGKVHPNSYNIVVSQISLEANTPINNTRYSNLNSSIVDPSNNWIANSMTTFVYGNTGPAALITVAIPYQDDPSIAIIANTRIRELGILGRMVINSGGQGYKIGDIIQFVGGLGTGAYANVTNVDTANGNTITSISFQAEKGHIVGGTGYDLLSLPTCNVISANVTAFGADISVTELLGTGGTFLTSNSTQGAIESVLIQNRGAGYKSVPRVDLSHPKFGDGKAQAVATIITGTYSYPGRFIGDDGFLSAPNFLEDQDYYQNFSYVIKAPVDLPTYQNIIKRLLHPAGMKLFGEFTYVSSPTILANTSANTDVVKQTINPETYVKTGNTINISYVSHGLANGAEVYLQFTSGNAFNSIYTVNTSVQNWFTVMGNNNVSTSGTVNVGILV